MCPHPTLGCSPCLKAAKRVLARSDITDEQYEALFKEFIEEEACGEAVDYVEPEGTQSSRVSVHMTVMAYEKMHRVQSFAVESMHGGCMGDMTTGEAAAAHSLAFAEYGHENGEVSPAAATKGTAVRQGEKRKRDSKGLDEGYGQCEARPADTVKDGGHVIDKGNDNNGDPVRQGLR